jgi:hypothetical protein
MCDVNQKVIVAEKKKPHLLAKFMLYFAPEVLSQSYVASEYVFRQVGLKLNGTY